MAVFHNNNLIAIADHNPKAVIEGKLNNVNGKLMTLISYK